MPTLCYERETYDFILRNLRKSYPARSGWKIIPQWSKSGSYIPDFVVERRRSSIIERVVVEAKAECYITSSHVQQLLSYAKKLAGQNVRIKAKILYVPAGATISNVARNLINRYNVTVRRLISCSCQ